MTGISPSQTVGPYFSLGLTPGRHGLRGITGNSLVTADTQGERIRIEGQVTDGEGAPIADALIEIWQADGAGRYAHPADERPRANSDFSGFGRASVDDDGRYWFETVRPGPVPGPDGTLQAPHINVGVFARGVLRRLHTRLYFEGEPANDGDPILMLVPEAARRATLTARRAEHDGIPVYVFDIRLQGEGETVFFEA